MDRDEEARRARAAARSGWTLSHHSLGDEPADDLISRTTAAERLAMVWRVTLDTWALSGTPLPEYGRHDAPGRLVRGHGER